MQAEQEAAIRVGRKYEEQWELLEDSDYTIRLKDIPFLPQHVTDTNAYRPVDKCTGESVKHT